MAEDYLVVDGKPIHTWWILFKELLVAAAQVLVERRLEGQHATIGSDGKQSLTNRKLPPSVCANVRHTQVEVALQRDLF